MGQMITHEQVMERLNYDPETGVFTRRMRTSSKVNIGDVAGYVQEDGYRRIGLNGKYYCASWLAFFVMYKRWPDPYIDHINGDRDDNRIENLREVTCRQNNQNLAKHRAGKLLGSYLMKDQYRTKPWRVRIHIGGKYKSIGCFATEQEAHEVYMAACAEVDS